MNDANDADFAYDRVDYPSYVIEAIAPNRLRAAALLTGWRAPDPLTASILEIGCGEGINLVAHAAVAPDSRAVGFDLARHAIERGNDLVARVGLKNVDLHVGDATTYPRDGEKFDYIVCHGVLTWVPEFVRDAILDLIAARLAPGGLAYISYDCLPGAGPKAAIVPFLRELTHGIADPRQATMRGLQGIALLNRTQSKLSRLKVQLETVLNDMPEVDATYFYHDWLAEHYAPIDLKKFLPLLGTKGLRIAGTVSGYELTAEGLEEAARNLIAACGNDIERKLSLYEVLQGGHIFHRDLFYRADAPPEAAPDGITELSFAFDGTRKEVDTEDGPAIEYALGEKGTLTTQTPEMIAVIDYLLAAGQREVPYGEIKSRTGVDDEVLRKILLLSNSIPIVTVSATPQPYALEPGERPRVGKLALALLNEGRDLLVTLRGKQLDVPQPETQLCLKLCDGTRTRAEVAAMMTTELGKPIGENDVDVATRHFARMRVFEA